MPGWLRVTVCARSSALRPHRIRRPARSVSVVPSAFTDGGSHRRATAAGDPEPDPETDTGNAGSEVIDLASVTRLCTLRVTPVRVGLPDSSPVLGSNVAHEGRFMIMKLSRSRFASA